jgi:uncharacterized membrane protein
MIGTLLYLIIAAIILGLVLWLVQQIPGMAPFAHIIYVVAIVIFVIIVIYVLIGLMGGLGGAPHLPR